MIRQFPQLRNLSKFLPELICFDRENFLLVFRYLDNYLDLYDFYIQQNQFPLQIASEIGKIIAILHRDSFDCQDYEDFLVTSGENQKNHQLHRLIRIWERIEPEIFGEVPTEGLKFFALYQKYDSLGKAIAELRDSFQPSCLTHNDLKLNNILLNRDWQQADENILRLIDWERLSWGDPAFDLGTIISSYLHIWLSSLVVSQSLKPQP
ncbi:MAG: phosphotransferase [Cyanobacteria bacterium P01_D01_bin.50]